MATVTTRSEQPARTLHLAFDLGNRIWTLAFATSVAHAPRLRTMSARNLAQLETEIAAAKARFGLAPDAPVVSCYEAGRDGFWLHRALAARGLTSHVVDSASISENRRARRTKSDRLDATALLLVALGRRSRCERLLPGASTDASHRAALRRALAV
jgi:transposase